jgi:hypothetical protein
MVLLAVMMTVLVFWRRHFVWFLSAMIPFPQTAMFIVAGQGVSPFYAAAIIASLLGFGTLFRSFMTKGARFVPFPGAGTLLLGLFALYATLITLAGPRIFEGMGVLSPRLGVGSQLANLAPLQFTISNFAQLAYMLLGVGAVIYVMSLRSISPRVLEAGAWVGLSVTLANALLGRAFPRELFDTIPTIYYQGGGRLRGPFAEPSVLGAFLVATMAYFAVRAILNRGTERITAVAGVLVAIFLFTLSTSGTTLVAGAVVGVVGLGLLIGLWVKNRMRGVETVSALVLLALAGVLAVWETVSKFVGQLVGDKLVSDSLEDRSAADAVAGDIFFQSFGMGVGLGSNRPSSFFFMMISCVGIIGSLLFFSLVIASAIGVMGHAPQYAASAWALLGVVTAMSIAKADLPTPMLWMALAVCMAARHHVWLSERASARAVLLATSSRDRASAGRSPKLPIAER